MATVGVLSVAVTANNAQFESGLKQSSKTAQRFSQSVKRSGQQAQRFSATLRGDVKVGLSGFTKGIAGATAAIAGLRKMMQAGAAVDEMAKFAKQVGITTTELQRLEFAAGRSGVSAETLRMAMQRMQRRVAEAAQGTGEAVKAIDALGLSAERLNQMSPDEQLKAFADALANVKNRGDQTRLAMKLFDSEGVKLIRMFDRGSAGLKEMGDEAERTGKIMSEETVAASEAMADRAQDLELQFRKLSVQIGEKLLPIIEKFVGFISEHPQLIAFAAGIWAINKAVVALNGSLAILNGLGIGRIGKGAVAKGVAKRAAAGAATGAAVRGGAIAAGSVGAAGGAKAAGGAIAGGLSNPATASVTAGVAVPAVLTVAWTKYMDAMDSVRIGSDKLQKSILASAKALSKLDDIGRRADRNRMLRAAERRRRGPDMPPLTESQFGSGVLRGAGFGFGTTAGKLTNPERMTNLIDRQSELQQRFTEPRGAFRGSQEDLERRFKQKREKTLEDLLRVNERAAIALEALAERELGGTGSDLTVNPVTIY